MFHRHDHHMWMQGHPWGHGYDWWPGTLLSTLHTVFWIVLFTVLVWALLRWLSPYITPMMTELFGRESEEPPALEILRRRYAAGEIDAVTFEQMRERLEASYQQAEQRHPS